MNKYIENDKENLIVKTRNEYCKAIQDDFLNHSKRLNILADYINELRSRTKRGFAELEKNFSNIANICEDEYTSFFETQKQHDIISRQVTVINSEIEIAYKQLIEATNLTQENFSYTLRWYKEALNEVVKEVFHV